MIAKILPLFVFLAVSHQWSDEDYPMYGVDPDTVSCDPRGEVHLLLPHHTNCSRFYMCAHGGEVEFSCAPGGLFFDFLRQTCNHAWATKCWLRKHPGSDPVPEDEGSGEEEFESFSNAEVEIVRNARSVSADAGNVRPAINCLRADTASKMAAYRGDCQRYWRCESGVPQASYCSDGLYFNEKKQQCDFEANVRCVSEREDELKTEFIVYK